MDIHAGTPVYTEMLTQIHKHGLTNAMNFPCHEKGHYNVLRGVCLCLHTFFVVSLRRLFPYVPPQLERFLSAESCVFTGRGQRAVSRLLVMIFVTEVHQ